VSKQKKSVDLGGLDGFNVSDLMGGSTASASAAPLDNQNTTGGIVYLPISILHDDPDNARTIFDEKEIDDLAESIKWVSKTTGKRRGIKEPLSVRRHPEIEGEYVINSGNRRKLAAIKAGDTEVPCFIDDDADDYDKLIVNVKRVGITAMEMAAFINRRIEAGDSKGDIAKAIGQPASFISDHVIFFEMPDFIRELYDENICTSMQGLATLHRAAKKNPDAVQSFCVKQEEEISVAQIRAFVESLKEKTDRNAPAGQGNQPGAGQEQSAPAGQGDQPGAGQEQSAPAGQGDQPGAGQEQSAPAGQGDQPGAGQEQSAPAGQDDQPGAGQEQSAPAGQDDQPGTSKTAEKELLQDLKQILAKVRDGDMTQLDAAEELIDLLIAEY